MDIIFAGTPPFARRALEAIHAGGHRVKLVLTQPDRPKGRGMKELASPVKEYALAHAIPVLQPPSLRLDGRFAEAAALAQAELRAIVYDVMVVAAYGLILPQAVLDIAPLGCVNIHASLLPRWRGAAPIQRAIEAGDLCTGITIMRMEAGLDTGPMLLQQSIPIAAHETAGELGERLAALGADLVVRALGEIGRGGLTSVVQPAEGVTYANKITREESRLNFTQPAEQLARKVRALNPAPVAFASYRGTSLKIWRAEAHALAHRAIPGSILPAPTIDIACGSDLLRVKEIQRPGGARLPAAEFLKGFSLEAGSSFD